MRRYSIPSATASFRKNAAETQQTYLVGARALAHNLGLRVVAEGVETEVILNQLFASWDATRHRAYLFSKAVSADDLTVWIDSQLWRDQVKVTCRT